MKINKEAVALAESAVTEEELLKINAFTGKELTAEDVREALIHQRESYEQQQGMLRKTCGFRQEG